MPVDTAAFREAHSRLGARVDELRAGAARLPSLTREERARLRQELLDVLRTSVEPHTKLDERLLYPAVVDRLGDALVAASMGYDHVAIRHWIGELEAADADDVPYLQELLYGLDALIRVHMWKENELFIGALESSDWPRAAEAVTRSG